MTVALMHETSSDTAGTAIEVLIGAPHREIYAPLMQLERQVANRVRKIDSHIGSHLGTELCNFF
jgi:hypothetical protein